jgi:glycosyltransferase involved in cell wall biosynthesis
MSTYRILMIAPTPFYTDRGCHVRIAGEAAALQALGHRVTICTYHNGRAAPGLDVRRIPQVPWYRKTSAGPSLHKLYLDLMLMALTARVARSEAPDIVHAHLHEGAFIAQCLRSMESLFRARAPRPVVFDLQGSLTGEMAAHRFVREGGAPYRVLRWLEGRIVRGADAVLPSSHQAAEALGTDFRLSPNRVEVVLDSLDADSFRPLGCRNEMRARLGIPLDRRVIGYLGVLAEYQGIDLLLGAMPSVLAREPEAHLLLMGWPNVERYAELARSLGVAERVTLTGEVAYGEAAAHLAAVDVAVAPKLATSESNHKIRNYMACGVPTVAFDAPTNREILGDNGIYAAETSCESLGRALTGALADPARSSELGRRARAAAVREFSWERAARQITAVYDRLLEHRKAVTGNACGRVAQELGVRGDRSLISGSEQ